METTPTLPSSTDVSRAGSRLANRTSRLANDQPKIAFVPEHMLDLTLDPNIKSLSGEYNYERAKDITSQLLEFMPTAISPWANLTFMRPPQMIPMQRRRQNPTTTASPPPVAATAAAPRPQILVPSADPDVYTVPSEEELLKEYIGGQECWVTNFTVGHKKFGSVTLLGTQNVYGLKLVDFVTFGNLKTMAQTLDNFASLGGLEVTVHRIFPVSLRQSPAEFSRTLQKDCMKSNWKFVSYENGSFKFQVPPRVEVQEPADETDEMLLI